MVWLLAFDKATSKEKKVKNDEKVFPRGSHGDVSALTKGELTRTLFTAAVIAGDYANSESSFSYTDLIKEGEELHNKFWEYKENNEG
jgi:hypothetical protein